MAKPSNPALWSSVKKKHRATTLGSPAGRWSPRKAALSRREYQKKGGKWEKVQIPPPPKPGQ